jgi:hypothetical protein
MKRIAVPAVFLSVLFFLLVGLLVRSMNVSAKTLKLAEDQQVLIRAQAQTIKLLKKDNERWSENLLESQQKLSEVIDMQSGVIRSLNRDITRTRRENLELNKRLSLLSRDQKGEVAHQ